MKFLRCYLGLGVLILSAFFAAQAQETAATPVKAADLVHFGDLIDVDVVGGFEFDWRGRVDPEGFLSGLDGVGDPFFALCRSEEYIAGEIAKRLARILREPKVVVKILDRSARPPAMLTGAVRTPTRFQIRRDVSLRELIVLAGGFLDTASGEISLFRPQNASCAAAGDNGPGQKVIKISDLLNNRDGADRSIFAGDIISVVSAEPVYVMGAVEKPGQIFAREELTLSRAIAMAGGLAKNADGGKVTIFRRDGGETKTIEAKLDPKKADGNGDELLRPFDIIEVAARGRPKQKYPPVAFGERSTEVKELPLKIVD